MPNLVYVHIDTISNAVMTQGIHTRDFYQGIVHQPKNLLLLNSSSSFGEFESHTGLKVVRGTESVNRFFQTVSKSRLTDDNKWIDFTDLELIKTLTPLEISELLYFGHMKTHLHSPFFYKLQNNFVFFDLEECVTRTYYRYLDEFYRILASRTFFRKAQPVEKLPAELLKSIRDLLRDGLVFNFEQAGFTNNAFMIPLTAVENSRVFQTNLTLPANNFLGNLIYHTDQRKWSLELEDDFAIDALPIR